MVDDLQTPFDVGVVMVTIVRSTFAQALRSIYQQRFAGRIQVLIGIDRWQGERSVLDQLIGERPSNVAVTVVDLGYSTSQRHGGLYPSHYGGALKSILSYAANSRYVTYLDDDNWYAPDHLTTLLAAIAGRDWAFSLRYFVDAPTGEMLCPDTWESVGPGRGVYADSQGGFVDTNCFLIDKLACHDVFPEWAMTRYAGGTGGDRQILQRLLKRPYGTNGAHTLYYRQNLIGHHPYLLWRLRCAGVDLGRFMPPTAIPSEGVWQECAEIDRRLGTNSPTAEGVR
ncbi:MAG TPA: glycosyltransferase family 2 protein [Casimicrobiaceae bacterium]|nr:glycosyltransferase family 2 protein [Casimicrobiaceae bacterium]